VRVETLFLPVFTFILFLYAHSFIVGVMGRVRISVSMRRFVRREKARIRREALDRAEAEKKIKELILSTHKAFSA